MATSEDMPVEVVGESVVSVVVPDSDSEASGSDSEPLPDPEPPVVSLLSRLKAPTASELSRKRKILKNPPKGKKREVHLQQPLK